jgi:hypothetical protein
MPKTFKSNLGLEDFDDVETIKNDTAFFTKRLAAKFATKVDAYKDYTGKVHNNYHLELKRTDGNHIYIR